MSTAAAASGAATSGNAAGKSNDDEICDDWEQLDQIVNLFIQSNLILFIKVFRSCSKLRRVCNRSNLPTLLRRKKNPLKSS